MKIVNQKVELLDSMGSDLSVVNAARVSFYKKSELEEFTYDDIVEGEYCQFTRYVLSEKDQKLLAYLAKHDHWSPFAHTSLQFRIKAPIFVARQLVKHHVGGVWNEVSRRYVDDEPEYFRPTWRWASENVKQGSGDTIDWEYSSSTIKEADEVFWNAVKVSHDAYLKLLKLGIAAEQARVVLDLNHHTEWIWTGSLMFFSRVCKQRLDSHAQAEAHEIAQMINDLIPDKFQYSWKALMHESD